MSALVGRLFATTALLPFKYLSLLFISYSDNRRKAIVQSAFSALRVHIVGYKFVRREAGDQLIVLICAFLSCYYSIAVSGTRMRMPEKEKLPFIDGSHF